LSPLPLKRDRNRPLVPPTVKAHNVHILKHTHTHTHTNAHMHPRIHAHTHTHTNRHRDTHV
jgi:hypothetical protein